MFEFGTPQHEANDMVCYYGSAAEALVWCDKFERKRLHQEATDAKRAFWRKVKAILKVWTEGDGSRSCIDNLT